MAQQQTQTEGESRHPHRTAKVIEIIGTSTKGFEDAVETAIKDASETTRDIRGAEVRTMSVRVDGGRIVEYKVDMKVAFGIERTASP